MQDNNMDYVPASIVKMLFDQSKAAIDSNTIAIKEMTEAVNDLAKVMSAPPSRENIMDEIKEHEGRCGDRVKETCQIIDDIVEGREKKDDIKKVEDEKQINMITSTLDTIKTNINGVLSRVNLMITVVIVALSVVGIIYYFVTTSVNTSVSKVLEQHIQSEQKQQTVKPEVPNAPK